MSGGAGGGAPGWGRVWAERQKAERAARNRANAGASTGPRTAAGKAVSAGNARRHGLSGASRGVLGGGVSGEAGLVEDAASLARRIAGPRAPPPVVDAALQVAEAQIALRRVRLYREALLRLDGATPARVSAAIGELVAVDRYERRARSRRKTAIRAFDRAWGRDCSREGC